MRVALAQLCSTPDIDTNLATCRELAARAAERGAHWILFPENAPFLGRDGDKLAIAEGLDGPMVGAYAEIARAHGAWVTLGSFPERIDGGERTYNTQVLLDPSGATVAVYRKIHLFDVEVEGGLTYRESADVAPGSDAVTATIQHGGQEIVVGLTTCYDLRFPELYRKLVGAGATVLTCPAAFTLQTGRDHWDTLLRARAIENQAWVVAPDQWGNHIGNRWSYGHSAVYDPWGARVAMASDGVGLTVAELDQGLVAEVRSRMPCLQHRRM